jgi:hypothetical protein
MKIGDYKQMMAYLTRPEQPKEQVADLVDELTPGPLKDELTKDYDPSQESYEEYLQRKALGERPFNAQDGGRANLAIGGGAIEGEDLGTREGFRRPMIPVSKLPEDQQKFINNWLKNNPDKTWEDLTNIQRSDLKKGQNVGVGYGGATLKGADNPAYQALSEKGKKIALNVYGTTDVSDKIRYGINSGKINMDTKPSKFQKDKDISVKMKRGANKADDVIFPNEQMKKDFIKAIKARVQQPEKAVVDFSNKELAKLFPISEKQASRAALYFINKLNLEYAKVKTKTASEIIKNTKNLIKQTSSFLQENRIRSAKTDILQDLDLQKKMDTAHRVSKTHMAKLGLQFNTDIMGIDSRLINQIIVKPSEVQLDRLYRKQYDIFEKLKKNPDSIELKNNLKNINKEVTDIVKNTSGRLVGVTIDPDTLETSFQGIKKKYSFSNVLGDSMTMKELENIPKEDQVKFLTKQLPKAIDLEVKRGFVPNDFKNILSNPNSQKTILKYAKQKAPELIEPLKKAFLNPDSKVSLKLFSSFPAITTAGLVGLGLLETQAEAAGEETKTGSILPEAAAASSLAFKPVREGAKKFGKYALQVAGTPLGATGLIAGFGIDPKKAMDRVGIEAELALAPELVKQSARFSPAVQRILNFGLSPTMAARAARIASPIGIASLSGEALYKYGKFVKDELDRIEKMSPEEREAYNISEQEQMGVAAADGGLIRQGFKGGGRQDVESQYGADSVGSYDSSQNVSNRDQVYGGNNFKSDPDDNREQYGAQGQYSRPPSTPSDGGGDNKINLINTLNKFKPNTFVNPYNFSVNLNKNIGPFGLNSFINTLGILGIDDPRTPEDESEQDDYGINAGYNTDLFGGNLSLGAGYSPTTGTNFGLNFSKQFNQGGRVGFADGPKNPGKRKTMKILAGLASLPILGRFFDVAQVAEKAAPAVVETFKNAPAHFIGLVNKIRALGRIVDLKKFTHPERFSNVYDYGDYRMYEKLDGGVEIQKQKWMGTYYGDAKVSEEYMSYNPKTPKFNKKGEKIPDEYEEVYEEYTAYPDGEGKLKDVYESVEPETIDEGIYSKEELEQLIVEQIENNLKKGKK